MTAPTLLAGLAAAFSGFLFEFTRQGADFAPAVKESLTVAWLFLGLAVLEVML
jgi:hypothetical protein